MFVYDSFFEFEWMFVYVFFPSETLALSCCDRIDDLMFSFVLLLFYCLLFIVYLYLSSFLRKASRIFFFNEHFSMLCPYD